MSDKNGINDKEPSYQSLLDRFVSSFEIFVKIQSDSEKDHKTETITHRLKIYGIIVTAFVGLLGYVFAAYEQNKTIAASEIEKKREILLSTVNQDLQEKKVQMQGLIKVMMNIRKIDIIARENCIDHKQKKEYTNLRLNAIADMIVQSAGTNITFNKQLLQNLKDFIAFDDNIKDVCAISVPNDKAWLAKQNNIFKIIEQMMEEDQLFRVKVIEAEDIKTLNNLNKVYYTQHTP